MKKNVMIACSVLMIAALIGCGQPGQDAVSMEGSMELSEDVMRDLTEDSEDVQSPADTDALSDKNTVEEAEAAPTEPASQDEAQQTTEDSSSVRLSQTELYQKYYDKLMETQGEYGRIGMLNSSTELLDADALGILYADLVDFDSDGIPELVMAYNDGTYFEAYADKIPYRIQIWGQRNGDIVKLYEDNAFNDFSTINVAYLQENGNVHIVTGYGLHESTTFWIESELKDGSFTTAHVLLCEYIKYDEATGTDTSQDEISIDGQKKSMESFLDQLYKRDAMTTLIPIYPEMDNASAINGSRESLLQTVETLRAEIDFASGNKIRYTSEELIRMMTDFYSMYNSSSNLHFMIEEETDDSIDVRFYADLPDRIMTLAAYHVSKRDASGNDLWGNYIDLKLARPSTSASAASAGDDYIFPDSDTRRLTEDDLSGLTREQLRIARNEIAARAGRKFNDETLQQYFNSKSWYHPSIEPEDFDARMDSILTDIAKENMNFIKAHE